MKNPAKIFSLYLFMLGASAIYGGWSIIYTNLMNFPPDLLSTTPFSSFVIPGLILAFVVGGTHIIAAILLWLMNKLRYEAVAVAGFCLLIWMCTEIYMIPSHHPVQIIYLGFAILTLIALMVFLKYLPVNSSR